MPSSRAGPPVAGAPPPPVALSRRGLIAAIASISVVGCSLALSFPLIALLMENGGHSSLMIGVNTSMSAVGSLVAAPLCPRWIGRLGLPRFLLACLLASAVLLLSFKAIDDFWWWLAARFGLGVAGAGLFMGSEYWIVAAATARIRGRIIAIYAMALSAGLAAGPALLREVGLDGWPPFVLAAGLSLAAAIPVTLAWREAPRVTRDRHGGGALRFFLSDPSVLFAVTLFGVVEFGAMALVPVWGVKLGMIEATAVLLAFWLGVGNLVLQPPIGWAADRFAPRPLLLLAALASVGAAALLPVLAGSIALLYAAMFVWGGLAAGLYTISLTAIGARYQGDDLADASASLVTAYSLGALIGPLLVGQSMDLLGPHGLSAALASVSVLYCALVVFRLRAA